MQGVYKVKHEDMKRLHSDVSELLKRIPHVSLEYIPRAQNARADELSNFAMDTRQNVSVVRPVELVAKSKITAKAAPSPIITPLPVSLAEDVISDALTISKTGSSLIEAASSETAIDMAKGEGDVWVLQFDGGSRGSRLLMRIFRLSS